MAYLRSLLPGATLAALVVRNVGKQAVGRCEALEAYPCDERGNGRVWVAEGLATQEWILFPWSPPEDREARDPGP